MIWQCNHEAGLNYVCEVLVRSFRLVAPHGSDDVKYNSNNEHN